jgi:hypothetical protein
LEVWGQIATTISPDTNIDDLVKQAAQEYTETLYSTKFEEVDDELTDGTYYYNYYGLEAINIEVNAGTIIYLGKSADGSDAEEIIIGDTEYYCLDSMNSLFTYIKPKTEQYFIINYEALVGVYKVEG